VAKKRRAHTTRAATAHELGRAAERVAPPDDFAELAKVPKAARESFAAQVIEIIEFAHQEQNVRRLKLFSTKEITAILHRVAREASKSCSRGRIT
jgi:hypothetical protein